MSSWNFDLSQAPRGNTVPKTVAAGKDADGNPKTKTVEEFVPDYIWAATNCGKVIRSYWQPATKHHNGHFYGFPSDPKYGSGPVAWQLYVVPVHPGLCAKNEMPRSDAGLDIVHLHSEINLPIIEDCGSGA